MNTVKVADNSVPIKAWDTVLFEKYCRFRLVLPRDSAATATRCSSGPNSKKC
jgi:hypothetical protein